MSSFTDEQGYLQPIADLHAELGHTHLLEFAWAGVRTYLGTLENV